jgi:hypothetical protein
MEEAGEHLRSRRVARAQGAPGQMAMAPGDAMGHGGAAEMSMDTAGPVNQEQSRRLASADAGMSGAKSPTPPSAHGALAVSYSLCAQAASDQAHAYVARPAPVDRAESLNQWVVLALAGTAAFMTTLDSSIVNIGLPSIAHSFHVPLGGSIEWVLIGYLVVIAAVLLTLGRLADMLGRKPLFLAGLAVFTLGSALCGAAPSLGAGCVPRRGSRG